MTKAMHVLFVTASYKPATIYGGPVFAISELAENLVRCGVIVDVYTSTANGKSELPVNVTGKFKLNGVAVRYYKRYFSGLFFSPGLLRRTWSTCRRVEVVHIHSWWNLISIISCVICVFRGVKPIVTLHGTMSDFSFNNNKTQLKNLFHRAFGRHLLGMSTLHMTSRNEYLNARKYLKINRHFILENIIPLPLVRVERNAESNELRIVYLGRLHPIKNLEILIRALNELEIPFQADIYGEGEDDYTRKLKLMASENIHFKGWVDGEKKDEALRRADLFVLVSSYENFGNVIIEALCQGTPVICTKGIGVSGFLDDNDLGWTIEPNVLSLTSAIQNAYRDAEKRKRIRETAAVIVSQNFHPEVLSQKYLQAYNSISARNTDDFQST